MNRVFGRGKDPYDYAASPYEVSRLAGMSEALGTGPFKCVLEIGSAEGAFTRKLADVSQRVIGLELSSVALQRSREALAGKAAVEFVEADVRTWTPPEGVFFDVIVLGDVLYYMDKPLVRDDFEKVFSRLSAWLADGGRILLAHGFAGEAEFAIRRGYRERFEALGLKKINETILGKAEKEGDVCCLLSLMEKQ
jgi:cyclopropane fatty-acyl-phospholipid synthase-like methyltransferase